MTASIALLAVIGVAWTLAVVVTATGSAELLHHDKLIEGTLPQPVAFVIFIGAWQFMIAAMMLPSTLPMLALFGRAGSGETNPRGAQLAFVGGYVAVWTGFGVLAFMGDTALHGLVDATPSLAQRPWLIAGSLIAVAGVAQFLPLTQACLRACRHPFAYLMEHYRPGTRAAFDLGRTHGLYCLGCCWALMLVMFAAGVANLVWMAALTATMVYEKISRHGRQVAVAAGVSMIGWAAIVLAHPAWLPHSFAGVS